MGTASHACAAAMLQGRPCSQAGRHQLGACMDREQTFDCVVPGHLHGR